MQHKSHLILQHHWHQAVAEKKKNPATHDPQQKLTMLQFESTQKQENQVSDLLKLPFCRLLFYWQVAKHPPI